MTGPAETSLDEAVLVELESVAVELARLAAADIETALGRTLAIRYKGAETREGASRYRDPASEADERIEQQIRARLAERFPEHGVVGEEMATLAGAPGAPIWVIDPIDGTANFVNGLPLFASSIGVVHDGRPVAGAIWCSASHALRPGVYHARTGGRPRFDEQPIERRVSADLRRWLAGEPEPTTAPDHEWEVRKLGSAAIECAFVAAGLLRVARFNRPHLWDVAAGIVLVEAAGGTVRERTAAGWRPFGPVEEAAIAEWERPLLVGEALAVTTLARSHGVGDAALS